MLLFVTYTALSLVLYFDLRERRIPNWLTLGMAGVGLPLQIWLRGTEGLKDSFLGFACGLLILLPLFAFNKFGGGDVKLLAALGIMRGWAFFWKALLLGAAAGGLFAVLHLLLHRELLLASYGLVTNTYRTQRTYPYSPGIALGVLLADLGWLL